MTLLEQLLTELPDVAHRRRMLWAADVSEAERIVQRARELNLGSIKYLLGIDRFEPRPTALGPYQAAYDVLMAGLAEVRPIVANLPSTLSPPAEDCSPGRV